MHGKAVKHYLFFKLLSVYEIPLLITTFDLTKNGIIDHQSITPEKCWKLLPATLNHNLHWDSVSEVLCFSFNFQK